MPNQSMKFDMQKSELGVEAITDRVLGLIEQWFAEENIKQTDVQKTMMASHVSAMVHRAQTLEKLPEVDPSLFDEISSESIQLARRVVDLFTTLEPEEAFLLSVHFEVARAN